MARDQFRVIRSGDRFALVRQGSCRSWLCCDGILIASYGTYKTAIDEWARRMKGEEIIRISAR